MRIIPSLPLSLSDLYFDEFARQGQRPARGIGLVTKDAAKTQTGKRKAIEREEGPQVRGKNYSP